MTGRRKPLPPRVRTKRARPVRIVAGPRCTRCGHPACPCCVTNGGAWCDVVTPDCELCCDGECTYEDTRALAMWAATIAPQLDRAFQTGADIITIEETDAPAPPPHGS